MQASITRAIRICACFSLQTLAAIVGLPTGQLLDREVFGLVVGQAQVVGRLVQRLLGFSRSFDRLVNALDGLLKTRRTPGASCLNAF